jgi:hypothetical protein
MRPAPFPERSSRVPSRPPNSFVSHVLEALRGEPGLGHVVTGRGRGLVDGLLVGPRWTIAVLARRPPLRPDGLVSALQRPSVPDHDGLLIVLDATPASPLVGRVAQQVGSLAVPRAVACWRPGADRTPLVAGLQGVLAVLDARGALGGEGHSA